MVGAILERDSELEFSGLVRTFLLSVQVAKISYAGVIHLVRDWTSKTESRYICVSNVHMLMEAYDSLEFRDVVNNADLVVPDGMPLVWLMRLKGQRNQQRVYGPTLMLHLLEAASQKSIPVGFYGGKPEVLDVLVDKMQSRYPDLKVAYSFSPPFRELSIKEDEDIVKGIKESGAAILFVGLGCPKQETWMARHHNRVNSVMLGVGAAFDFHAGTKPQSPAWMQMIGLEWLFRLITEPRRLWRRYLYHNTRFVFLAIADLLGLLEMES